MNGESVFQCFRSCCVYAPAPVDKGSGFPTLPSLLHFFPSLPPPSNSPPSQCEESVHLSSHKCSLQQCWHMRILTAVGGGGRRTIRSSMSSLVTQSFQSQPGLYETLSQKMENFLLATKYPMNPECLALLMGSWHQDDNMGFGEPQKRCFYLAV